MRFSLPLVAAMLLAATARAAEDPAGTASVKELSPGVYEIGQARLEQKTRTVTFPGAINQVRGLLEYLIVTKNGPTHESLLVTDLAPNDLHLAMLLLGAKGSPPPTGPQKMPPPQITEQYLKSAPPLLGEHISIMVDWHDAGGAEKSTPPEDWLYRVDMKRPAARGPWLYTGSMFGSNGRFVAEVEGLFAALVTNPGALINNPRPGHESDQIWTVNEKTVPPIDTPVQIKVQLLADEPAAPAK
jgi:hypothetical protein